VATGEAAIAGELDAVGSKGGVGRWPPTAVFFLNGLTLSTYLVRVPTLKDDLRLTNGQLAVVGLLFALAALTCMQFVGPLVARMGSRSVLCVALLVMPVLLALVGLVDGLNDRVVDGAVAFPVAATALGAAHGTTDAAMNAYAVSVERRLGRPILSSCHAAWSLSAVIASLTTAGLARGGVPASAHLLVAAGVLLAGGLTVGRFLPSAGADQRAAGGDASSATTSEEGVGMMGEVAVSVHRRGWRDGWTRGVVTLGLVGTALMVCEGAVIGWGAIFLHDGRGASLSLAAAAITAYMAGQTGGRLVGDRLTARYGPRPVFRVGGLVAACGLAGLLLTPRPQTAIAGFAVMGIGGSVLLPLTFSAVGQLGSTGANSAAVVARFTTFTYAGILLGPAAIGWVSELVGLAWTLSILVPVLFVVALGCRLPGRGSLPDRGARVRA
jgi:MFS family permease